MKFCQKCGKELLDEVKFCDACGTAVEVVIENQDAVAENTTEDVTETEAVAEEKVVVSPLKKVFSSKKIMVVAAGAIAVLVIVGILIGNAISLNKYEDKMEKAYDTMVSSAADAEKYCSLQSKVWRNSIYEQSNTETDKYTKDENGRFYSDFNDALGSFYDGEGLLYLSVSLSISDVDNYMSELKKAPKKFEEEYAALKQLYVAYSDLADLVIGTSSYSLNSFNDALESAKSSYKSAESSARLVLK